MLTLLDAIQIATDAHAGQRYGNKPYISHPLAVMEAVREHGTDTMIVAVLHDVLEDTEVTMPQLRTAGLPMRLARALDALTRRDGERYADYLMRVVEAGPPATTVKRADSTLNLQHLPKGHTLRSRYENNLSVLTAAGY